MRSLVRRDTEQDYETFVKGLAKSSGVPTPTRKELVRFDRKRKKKTSRENRLSLSKKGSLSCSEERSNSWE